MELSLLKHVKQKVIEGLVIIFNKSFKEGHFPELLKIAKVIPVYKGDDLTNPINYRPISLLHVFDKLLEELMYNRLEPFFQKHNVFYKYQSGFRKNHATNNALTEVVNYIYKLLDEGNYVFGIYIDLKKAFDTVQHKILLYKLSKRKQFLVVNNTQSDISDLCEYGVPQGSVLGSMLFLLFINDIHRSFSEITIKLFADDTDCFISDKDFNSLEKLAERELNKLRKWINANKLTINFDLYIFIISQL